MATGAVTIVTNCCKGRTGDTTVHPRQYELNHHYGPRSYGGNNHHNLWISIKLMVRRQHNKSSQPGTGDNRDRKRNRNYLYYGILVSILTIGAPAYAEEGETNNTSNPVAAATGNVTNQAVQFQNNGAPSRQILGPNISCNGATMTFSPFYMGNHTTPWGVDDEYGMEQKSYTVAENWGAQINFMVPLDGSLIERCKAIGARQQAKMELDYELVRVLKCAELQQKGFMIRPLTRVYHMCQDVIPISAFKAEVAKALAKKNPPPPKKWYQKLNPFNK